MKPNHFGVSDFGKRRLDLEPAILIGCLVVLSSLGSLVTLSLLANYQEQTLIELLWLGNLLQLVGAVYIGRRLDIPLSRNP